MRQYARLVAMGMAVVAASATLSASVFDEAKFWWKFDQGGADGAVVQTSEIHDCRDASVGEATRVCGPSGGPIWTNTSSQIRPSMVDFGNGYVNSDTLTFFARICPGDTLNDGVNYVGTDERFIFNDNFVWGSAKSNSYGYLLGLARRNATSYYPKIFIGQEQDTFSGIALETGKWYDLAFSVSMVTNMTSTTHTDITTNDVTGVTTTNVTTSVTTSIVQRALCVVAGEKGLFYQTLDRPFQRQPLPTCHHQGHCSSRQRLPRMALGRCQHVDSLCQGNQLELLRQGKSRRQVVDCQRLQYHLMANWHGSLGLWHDGCEHCRQLWQQ